MVNVPENRTRVQLELLGPPAPGPDPGWQVYPVRVETADPVEGYRNLLAADLPREVEALVPAAVAARFADGSRWRVEVALVGPGRIRVEAAG
jgi:hypothetical protein